MAELTVAEAIVDAAEASRPRSRTRPLDKALEVFARRRGAGDDEQSAAEAAVREALRLVGRPLPSTPRGAGRS